VFPRLANFTPRWTLLGLFLAAFCLLFGVLLAIGWTCEVFAPADIFWKMIGFLLVSFASLELFLCCVWFVCFGSCGGWFVYRRFTNRHANNAFLWVVWQLIIPWFVPSFLC
jgi:hypothetical protein